MKNFSWNKANDLTEIENKSKLKTISTLFDKKAEENNTIDLNAYERGLLDMYDYLIERLQTTEGDKLKTAMIQIEKKEIEKGIDEAYKKAGSNACFSNVFQAGVDFAVNRVKNLTIDIIPILSNLRECYLKEFNNTKIKDLKPKFQNYKSIQQNETLHFIEYCSSILFKKSGIKNNNINSKHIDEIEKTQQKEQTLYNLELHETLVTKFGIMIMRVPNGWIYDCWDNENDNFKNGIFVPFDDRFKK